MNIGEILKNERVRQHLTIEDISKALKLHHSVIEDLENNRFEAIAPVYAVGFIKKYCEFLKFDHVKIKEILDYYNDKIAGNIKTNIAPEGDILEGSKYKKNYLKIILVLILFFMIFLFVGYLYRKYRISVNVAKNEKPELQKNKKTIAITSEAVTRENVVKIVVLRKVFLTVYEGKDLVFSGILKKGVTEQWKSEKPIIIRVALPDAIKMLANGKDLGVIKQNMAYPNEIVVRKSGLKVRRFR